MDNFKLSIKMLEYEWADLELAVDGQEKLFYFEKVPNDPLYDLLESAIKIIGKVDSTITFHNGSQREYLTVKSAKNNLCHVETEGINLMLPVKQLTKAVLRMFDSYVFAFSRDEYCNQWSAFPSNEIEKLRVLYHSL